MSRIKILSEDLANRIAAGEVVERPASVVKELLENAIDAGARNIAVHVEGGGTRLIRVIDDGEGMDQDDLLLCLERHATSKLLEEDRLNAINTLGFRGEAVPSIASVSRFSITSRPPSAELGARVDVRFGRLDKVHEMGCAPGTVIEVRDLFGSVPARRKFLKSVRTELTHIENTIKNYAVFYYGLGFSYAVDDRTVLNLGAGEDSPEKRLERIIGSRFAGRLIPVASGPGNQEGETGIKGFILPPEESFGGTAGLRIFVNGRPVRDRMIAHAAAEGLHGFLLKGRSAAGMLSILLPAGDVDVNVHPGKLEVRFRKPAIIHQLIVTAVQNAMERREQSLRFSLFGSAGNPENRQAGIKISEPAPEVKSHRQGEKGYRPIQDARPQSPGISLTTTHVPAAAFRDNASGAGLPSSRPPLPSGPHSADHAGTSSGNAGPPDPNPVGRLFEDGAPKAIGQVFKAYILCEQGNGFLIIDQHAAHERVLFERLKLQFDKNGLPSQILLFPKVMEAAAAELQVLKRFEEEIARLGLDVRGFGGNSYVVKAVPAIMAKFRPEEIMAGVFERFNASASQAGAGSAAVRLDGVLAGIACKAAVKAGRSLNMAEIDNLLRQMHESRLFSHCPHGRPVMKRFSADDVARWFCRT